MAGEVKLMSPSSMQLKCMTLAQLCLWHRHLLDGIGQASLAQGAVSSVAGLLVEKAALYSHWEEPWYRNHQGSGEHRPSKNSLGLEAYPLPPQMQQALLKILQWSDQKSSCSVFPVQVWDPPALLMWRWFINWTKSLPRIPTWERVSRSLYILETLAGSWAWQHQTAVTFTSSSLNPSVTHLPLPQIGHKQLHLQFWKPFLYFTIILFLLQVIFCMILLTCSSAESWFEFQFTII